MAILDPGSKGRPRPGPDSQRGEPGVPTPRALHLNHDGGSIMAVARSDDGPGNLTRKRTTRKIPGSEAAPPPTGVATAPPPPAPAMLRPLTGPAIGMRLDDLYRLAMPKLFALSEREGIVEHTG